MTWDTINRMDSTDTDVCKFVFTKDDAVAEAVLYKYGSYKDRTVICCSTQSGCPMGCTFCGTGKQFIRNLTTDEIVAQVKACLDHAFYNHGTLYSDIDKFQIMFMSMGEPMLNWKALKDAIQILHYSYRNAALLISTSAPETIVAFGELIELSKEIPQIGLQFSVHESLQEERDKLIPFKKKLSLRGLAATGEAWAYQTGRKVYFNYCVHEKNNGVEDAQRLSELFKPEMWEATISVICEADESVSASIERQEELATDFSGLLLEQGYNTRVFNPAGQDDIGGGCGQLWFTQEWMKNNPDKVRKTRG
jgi:23S rRNA (adenine2503-C2)-methyltransferase